MSTPLHDARARIDALDRRLVAILAERQAVVDEICALKARSARAVRDPAREDALLARVRALAADAGLAPEGVARLFEQILAQSVARQRATRAHGGPACAPEAARDAVPAADLDVVPSREA
jgi:chorismate mutase